jgi:hypothetical protein
MAVTKITGSGLSLIMGTNAEVMTTMNASGLSFSYPGTQVGFPTPGSMVIVMPRDL